MGDSMGVGSFITSLSRWEGQKLPGLLVTQTANLVMFLASNRYFTSVSNITARFETTELSQII